VTAQGANAGITERISDYYRRQIAWLRDAVGALDVVLASTDEPNYDQWSAEDAARARKLDELVAEFSALKKEWSAARGISAADRDAIGVLKQQVDTLRAEFDDRRVAVTARLASAVHSMRGEAGDLRRGRGNARKYGTGETDGGAIVDRRA